MTIPAAKLLGGGGNNSTLLYQAIKPNGPSSASGSIDPSNDSSSQYWTPYPLGIINVRDFGAKGDGVTDDTLAFQKASSTGKNVFVPGGTYNLTKTFSGNFYSDEVVEFTNAICDVLCTKYINQENRKSIKFVSDFFFPGYQTALNQVKAVHSDVTALYPQACCHSVENGEEKLYVFYKSESGIFSTNVLAIFNITNNNFEKYYILADSWNGEGLAFREDNGNKYIYAPSQYQGNRKARYTIAGDSGSTLSASTDVFCDDLTGGLPFFSRNDNGEWIVYGSGAQTAYGPSILSLYDDNAQYKGQIAWDRWDHDILTGTSSDGEFEHSIPHLQGLFYDSGNLYLFKGALSTSMGNSTDIGVIQKDSFGQITRSSLCKSELVKSKFSSMFNKNVQWIENEGGFVYNKKVYSLDIANFSDGSRKIFLLEEFSHEANSVDFSDIIAYHSNTIYCSNRFFPLSKDYTYRNPYTNDVLTTLDDIIFMMVKYSIPELSLNLFASHIPPYVTVHPDGGAEPYIYRFYSDTQNNPFNVKITLQTGSTIFIEFTARGRFSHHVAYLNDDTQIREIAPQTFSSRGMLFENANSYLVHGIFPNQSNYCGVIYAANDPNIGNKIEVGSGSTTRPQIISFGCSTGRPGETGGDNYAVMLFEKCFRPNATNSITLGHGTYRWKDIYVNTATLTESDRRIKDEISDIDERVLRAWGNVRLRVFKYISSVNDKGSENARIHTGVIAQEVQDAFVSEGIDATKYGLFCYDKWEDQYEEEMIPGSEDEFGRPKTEQKLVMEAGDMYSIRYEEALVLECAYLRDRLSKAEERIAALEAKMEK